MEGVRERAHELDARLTEVYPDVYAGLVLKDQMTAVEVYLTDLDQSGALAEAREIAADVPIHFTHVLNSLKRLRAVLEGVGSESEDVRAEGIDLVVFGIDLKINRVHLQVDGLTLDQANHLSARFGPNYVYVYPGRGAVPASLPQRDSRHSQSV